MYKKYKVVRYEPSTSLGVTSTQSINSSELVNHEHTSEKILKTCQEGFETEQDAEIFINKMKARYPYNHYRVEDYLCQD